MWDAISSWGILIAPGMCPVAYSAGFLTSINNHSLAFALATISLEGEIDVALSTAWEKQISKARVIDFILF